MAAAGVGLRFVPSRKGKGPPNDCGTCAAPSHSGPRLHPPSKEARPAAVTAGGNQRHIAIHDEATRSIRESNASANLAAWPGWKALVAKKNSRRASAHGGSYEAQRDVAPAGL